MAARSSAFDQFKPAQQRLSIPTPGLSLRRSYTLFLVCATDYDRHREPTVRVNLDGTQEPVTL